MIVVDEAQFRRLPGAVAAHRAGHAPLLGNLALTEHQSYAAGMASLRRAGHHADALGCTLALADIRIAQGRLREAMRTHEQALKLAAEQGPPVLRGTADMHVGMSRIHRERNDLQAAIRHLQTSQELGEHTGLPQNPYRWRVAMAGIEEARGDLDGALALIQDAERLYVGDFFPDVHPVSALKVRMWVAQGKLVEAMDWTREQGLSVEDDLSYLRECEHITLARVLLARRATPDAMRLLKRLLRATSASLWMKAHAWRACWKWSRSKVLQRSMCVGCWRLSRSPRLLPAPTGT